MDKTKTIMIDGIEFSFNVDKAFEQNGHVYCRKCGERIDSEPLKGMAGVRAIIYHRQCKCDREREEQRKAEEKAMEIRRMKERCFETSRNLMNCSFERIDDPKRKEVVVAKNFVDEFESMYKDNVGLIFHGNAGSGKTYLAACIANRVIEKYMVSVKMRNIPEIVNDIETGGFDIDKTEYYNRLANVRLLILDDFGIERHTEYVNEMVYQIINTRYEKKRPTIISTNIPIEVIMEGGADISKERIYSRIREMCIPVKVAGVDRRTEIGIQKREANKKKLYKGFER